MTLTVYNIFADVVLVVLFVGLWFKVSEVFRKRR